MSDTTATVAGEGCGYSEEDVFNYVQDVSEGKPNPEMAQHVEQCARCRKFRDGFNDFGQMAAQLAAPAPHLNSTMERLDLPSPSEPAETVAGSGRTLGPYRILRLLGRGGMGSVYEALDSRLNRRVALKVMISTGPEATEERERFRREALHSAKLRHPNIVPVHDVGNDGGREYLVMDYVEGLTLGDAMRQRTLTYREKAAIVEKVARAVQYAHEQGIIHRDLKPGNIMLEIARAGSSSKQEKPTKESGKAKQAPSSGLKLDAAPVELPLGEPLVLDFGLAKEFNRDTSLSHTGQVLGTPSYMPPEQAEGNSKAIGPRSDVYGLGAVLYELLTGRPPFIGESALKVLRAVSADDPVPPRSITPDAPRDLETICLKCLEKKPERRYETAAALADDLKAWLCGESISARAPSSTERMVKWASKRPAVAALVVVSVLALAAILGGGAWYNTRLASERNKATTAAAKEKAEAEKASLAEKKANRRLADSLISQADALCLAGRARESLNRYAEARSTLVALGESSFLADVAALELLNTNPLPMHTFTGHKAKIWSVVFSPEGQFVLSGSADQTLILWDVKTGNKLRTFTGYPGEITSVAFSPDGKLVLSGGAKCQGNDNDASQQSTVRIWDVATGREVRSFSGITDQVNSIAVSPDGQLALVGSVSENPLSLWSVSTGRELRKFGERIGRVWSVSFSPDGKLALSGGDKKQLKLWDVATGHELVAFEARGNANTIRSVAFSPDGKLVLSENSLGDYTLKLSNVSTGSEVRTFSGHTDNINSISYSPSGKKALSGSDDMTLKLWDMQSERELQTFRDHSGPVNSVAFSPNGSLGLSGSEDGTVKLWTMTTDEIALSGGLAFSPDGKLWLVDRNESLNHRHVLELRDAATGLVLKTFSGQTGAMLSGTFSPDGKMALSGGENNTLKLWDIATGRELKTFDGHTKEVCSVAFSPDGNLALSGSRDKDVKLWDVATGRELRTLSGHTDQVYSIAFSPDGKAAISGSADKDVKLWDVVTGRELRTLSGHTDQVYSVAFSPDGNLVLSGSRDKDVKLWDVATGRELRTLGGHTDWVLSVAFSPYGKWALSGSRGFKATLLDVMTGQEIRTLDKKWLKAFGVCDLVRPTRDREFAAVLPKAREALQKNENDAEALKTLGEWHAFRGLNDWAVDFLERARKGGATVASLTLARCYWRLSIYANTRNLKEQYLANAAAEFKKEIARVTAQPAPQEAKAKLAREQEELYLNLCLQATLTPSQPATTSAGPAAMHQGPFEYTINNNTVTIVKYSVSRQDLVVEVPSVIKGLPVTGIGISAFGRRTKVATVKIPNSVTSIGPLAFINCDALTDVLLPEGISSIERSTFAHCSGLTNLTIPDHVISIGKYAFKDCPGLTRVTLPEALAQIDDEAFADCPNLLGVYFKGNVPKILGQGLLTGTTKSIVYYRPGTQGWEKEFAGRPTAPWNPEANPAATASAHSLPVPKPSEPAKPSATTTAPPLPVPLPAPTPVPAPAPVSPAPAADEKEKAVEGLEANGRWYVENWGDPGTVNIVDGTATAGKILVAQGKGGKQGKTIISRTGQPLNLTESKETLFKIRYTCAHPLSITISFTNGKGDCFESSPLLVPPNTWTPVKLDTTAKILKSNRNDWKAYDLEIEGRERITRISYLVYSQEAFTLEVDGIFFLGDDKRPIPLPVPPTKNQF